MQHILCSSSKLVQTDYKKRYHVVGQVIHWEVSKEHVGRVEYGDKWFVHFPKSAEENEEVKLLWDFTKRQKGNNHSGHNCSC